ncbi:MAG: tryptophan synthase subunit alpha [Candidatus Latescibacteria bacterium]|nr:tryptophan synthase subunit alpha [Candidatus Latescibacterota bacterium]
MSRLSPTFQRLAEKGRSGFVAYITAGDPDLEATRSIVLEMARRGVDILELGIPFSDPMADGPANQVSAQRALENGVSLGDVLRLVEDLRGETELPIVLFTYYNPVFRYGLEAFVDRASEAGVDGVLALDLPPEEAGEYKRLMDDRELDTIFLITPTTRDDRIRLITSWTTGFVYTVSRTGVTGEQDRLSDTIQPMVDRIRKHTFLPVAVGFGISRPDQVGEVASYADAVVVGSAINRRIGEFQGDPQLVRKIGDFVETLTEPLKGAAHGDR